MHYNKVPYSKLGILRMRQTNVTCDGCGQVIQTASKYGGYSHFELTPVPIDHSGETFIYANGFMPEDIEQFCYSCKNKMIAALPNAYEFCGICMHKVKTKEMARHRKVVHPNWSTSTVNMSLSPERTFSIDQTIPKGDVVE